MRDIYVYEYTAQIENSGHDVWHWDRDVYNIRLPLDEAAAATDSCESNFGARHIVTAASTFISSDLYL